MLLQPGYDLLRQHLNTIMCLDDVTSAYLDAIANSISATSYQEIALIQAAGLAKLDQHNRTVASTADTRWTIFASSREAVLLYTRLVLLSPRLSVYRGKNIAELAYMKSHASP